MTATTPPVHAVAAAAADRLPAPASVVADPGDLAPLLPLFRELGDLKRIRVAARPGSLAARLFARAWAALVGGADPGTVARRETAHALASARLAGIDAAVLAAAGLTPVARRELLARGFDAVAGPLDPAWAAELRTALDADPLPDPAPDRLPSFARALAAQPRAGATRPGRARVVLEPAENHAEHCALVAVYGALAAPLSGADAGRVFLTGLAHHLHNAQLPDAGDAGDGLLGDRLGPIMETFREAALAELPAGLRERVRAALASVYRADGPEDRAFQVADTCDRVLEMEWHARTAAFTLDVALGEMDIIHPGPVQSFQLAVVRRAGLRPAGSDAAGAVAATADH